ncbi:MAG TPA: acetyl-CoA carboxylase biotin carboxylase subunit [Verrucomicrobiales bacterium]|nr:acetyl-CoA carboxylase biotin carboxylase subunit [Verrucomicrobiales bacterium]
MFKKVLVANRGEIALRVIRACKELDVKTVAVYSEADVDSMHVHLADEAICIGPGPSSESYLKISRIISAAEIANVDAIHPGYGFLSEKAEFAEVCEKCKIKFIGPSARVISIMGDKNVARETALKAGMPITPGSDGIIHTEEEALEWARKIGYPVMVKASAGGGGRGMRPVLNEATLGSSFQAASLEAMKCFGDGSMYMEKLVEKPHHIEFQIVADSHGNVVHLGERDCSMQRRNQKIIEECPSPKITPEMRKRMGDATVKLCKEIGYENCGTIEFLVDNKCENFYFMEMNTRIQVEHPVTEMVTGVDLIAEQLRIAGGEPISVTQEQIKLCGHAIEVRINAEDPRQNFRPAPGKITGWLPPGGPGVRVDSHVYTGYEIPPFYDSLIGKVIVWGTDREHALKRLRRALSECAVTGIPTTIDFHLQLLDRPEFLAGDVHTKFVEQEMLPQPGS